MAVVETWVGSSAILVPSFSDNREFVEGVLRSMSPLLDSLPSRWGSLSELATPVNVVVLGDMEPGGFTFTLSYHEWRRRRLQLWQLLYRYRDHAGETGLERVEPWPWGHVEALATVYGLQLPVDVQAVALVLGWPWVFSRHYSPVDVHPMLSHMWRYRGDAKALAGDGGKRLLSDGGLLHLVETPEGVLTFADLCDPVVGQLWTLGNDSDSKADNGSGSDVVVSAGETVLELLLRSVSATAVYTRSVTEVEVLADPDSGS